MPTGEQDSDDETEVCDLDDEGSTAPIAPKD
jgi:hypothetical protein